MKLFLFVTGGSGSRVVKALSMLMAAGLVLNDTETVIPIIIDPDSSNGDLSRTVDILRTYKEIRLKTYSPESKFFRQKLTSLDELGDGGFLSDNFIFDIDGVREQLFKEFIGYSSLSDQNKALISLLFSKANLDAAMNIGFNGNPNIGSVVLNKFKDTTFFKKFAANFVEGDRIFIISSIFGGTGAAGFPLIVKNIRDARHPLPNHYALKNARIGAVTLLPYFSIAKNEETKNDSGTFYAKTKAALAYYARNLSGNSSLNALYYAGDHNLNEQQGADGALKQKNKAHFIELAAALAIEDFMSREHTELQTANGTATNPKYLEFGIERETGNITFKELSRDTYNLIAVPLTTFQLFKNFMANEYAKCVAIKSEAFVHNGNNKLGPDQIGQRLLGSIEKFGAFFTDWLSEMQQSSVSFSPFDLDKKGDDILDLVIGWKENRTMMGRVFGKTGLNHFRGELSTKETAFDHLESGKKLMALFSTVATDLSKEHIKL